MIDIPPEIQSNQLKIPPMLIQPLVENALKHGISSKSDIRGQIWITVQIQTQAVLKIVVRDNGPEFSTKKSSSGLSFSSGIIKDRLSLLNKQLKRTDFKLELRSEYFLNQSTTVAEITLPLFS
jgi:sensor histidine kinase YesM